MERVKIYLVKKEEISGNNIKNNTKMINFHYVTNEDMKLLNGNWPQIPDHPYRILIVGCSISGKTNALSNPTSYQPGTDEIYLYAKDPHEVNYQLLIKKREGAGIKHFNDSESFSFH